MKRFLLITLSIILTLVLCACGSKANKGEKGDETSSTTGSEIVGVQDDPENPTVPFEEGGSSTTTTTKPSSQGGSPSGVVDNGDGSYELPEIPLK